MKYLCLQEDDDDDGAEKPFYDDEEDSNEEEEGGKQKRPQYIMDRDHRLLLKSAKPLLQSRNAAVSFLKWVVVALTLAMCLSR